jgi:opacity protein-like surface antigen
MQRGATNTGYDTYLGTAGVTVALSRNISLGTSYSYYRYRFGTGATLPVGLARDVDRQSIQAYVSLWAPLINRSRRPNASR